MFVFGDQQLNRLLTKVQDCHLLVAISHGNKTAEGESLIFTGLSFCWKDDFI